MNDVIANSDAELGRLAVEIRDAHEAASAAGTRADALQYAREAGQLLTHAKDRCPHGSWLPWVTEHCPDIGPRQVQKYMKLAANWDGIAPRMNGDAHLSIEGALRLLAEDPDDEPESHLSPADSDSPAERRESPEHEHEDEDEDEQEHNVPATPVAAAPKRSALPPTPRPAQRLAPRRSRTSAGCL